VGSVEREYKYQHKWTTIVLCAAFFGLCTVVLGFEATGNNRDLVINHLVELSPDWAIRFHWLLTAFGAGSVVITAFLAYHRLTFHQRLLFGPTAMRVPTSSWSRNEKEIAYRDIQALSELNIRGQRLLFVTHSGGTDIIQASMLPSKAVFAEVCELLAARKQDNA